MPIQELRRNEQIRISPVRVIGSESEQLGILPTDEALRMARDAGVDLVEVAPNVRPPVCRIMDYGKWKYLQKKRVHKRHEQLLKEVRLRLKTDDHDRMIKFRKALGFLEKGAKVQFTMRFRGRERAHRERAILTLRQIAEELGERVKIMRPPSMDGRHMVMVVAPIKPVSGKAVPQKTTASQAAQHAAATSAPTVEGKQNLAQVPATAGQPREDT